MKTLTETLGASGAEVNRLLWDTYEPYVVCYPFAAIGAASLVGMLVFSRLSKRWEGLDV